MNRYRNIIHDPGCLGYIGSAIETPAEGCYEIILQRGRELLEFMISTSRSSIHFGHVTLRYPDNFSVPESVPNNRYPISAFKDGFCKSFQYFSGVSPYCLWVAGMSEKQFFSFAYFVDVSRYVPDDEMHWATSGTTWTSIVGAYGYGSENLIEHSPIISLNKEDTDFFESVTKVMNVIADMARADETKRNLPRMSRLFSNSKI